ncbi:hypothetical protein [Carboxylicivirga sp. M1479]|uniref:hypothetical protein n=1 Tax=Carboxylicivirga sp. M1479 TaxID=2594476 RepID=UPI0011787857|nr:hypothetical protein [Carboxylicivirga sp. M1479]TRX71194.1 hypothetical protein FNN09_08260 [Carboxylicivirga sp. M1479]
MKQLIIAISIFIISVGTTAQIAIEKDGTIEGIDNKGVTRVIAGGDYYITTESNENGEAYHIESIPVEGNHLRPISEDEFTSIKTAFEEKFDMELQYHQGNNSSKNEGIWSSRRDNVSFEIDVMEYDSSDYQPYEIKLSITHEE